MFYSQNKLSEIYDYAKNINDSGHYLAHIVNEIYASIPDSCKI